MLSDAGMGVGDGALLGLEGTPEQPKGQTDAEQVSESTRIHGGVEHTGGPQDVAGKRYETGAGEGGQGVLKGRQGAEVREVGNPVQML